MGIRLGDSQPPCQVLDIGRSPHSVSEPWVVVGEPTDGIIIGREQVIGPRPRVVAECVGEGFAVTLKLRYEDLPMSSTTSSMVWDRDGLSP